LGFTVFTAFGVAGATAFFAAERREVAVLRVDEVTVMVFLGFN
jgi:hypothetical protein